MSEGIEFLSEKEVRELDKKDTWKYISFLIKKIEELKIKAEKNCSQCNALLMGSDDLNIELFFEDYRACQEHCDKCGKEERVLMCELQHEILNHMAEQIHQLQYKLNMLVNGVLRKDDIGEELLAKLQKAIKEKTSGQSNMFT